MKQSLSGKSLPSNAVLITCSSHEDRCKALIKHSTGWKPSSAVLFHYDDENPRREANHQSMESDLRVRGITPETLTFTESNAVKSLHDNMKRLRSHLNIAGNPAVVLDLSVFTKRHLLMMLRWLDDDGFWDRLWITYSEPEDYDVSSYLPLSFGLASMRQIPGFSACPDLSRPVYLLMFLGYEGDRALAVYEEVQPMMSTLIIPHPPYRESWIGRTEEFNRELLTTVGQSRSERVDALDPEASLSSLRKAFGESHQYHEYARIVCPLGTKPQTLGVYMYLRECIDPPAVIYASPLRHNHEFFSHGMGATWLLKDGKS